MVVAGIAEIDQHARSAEVLYEIVQKRRVLLVLLLRQVQQDGSVGKHINPEISADVLLALLQGMRVIGKVGVFPEDTRAFVDHAMRVISWHAFHGNQARYVSRPHCRRHADGRDHCLIRLDDHGVAPRQRADAFGLPSFSLTPRRVLVVFPLLSVAALIPQG